MATKTAKKPTNGAAPKAKTTYSPGQYEHWYYQMLLMRRFEEKVGQIYGMGKIKGFCHLYIGQEAVGAGVESAMRPTDYLISGYREHGNALGRGIPPRQVMAELYGKATGCTKGKGGSMHMFSREHNFFGGHGIVGAQIGLGAGMAFAQHYRQDGGITVAMYGDGAARQGILHETYNLAMLWKLPVVFICENNFYAMGTAVERSSNVTEIVNLARSYDMPAMQINGMDVEEVHAKVGEAIAHARAGNGPYHLEIQTYRYKGHSMSDPAKYRSKEELEAYKDQDPLAGLKARMLHLDIADEAWFEALEERIKAEVQDAVDFAEQSPYPDAAELFTDIYTQADYPYMPAAE